jgi:hypothetical protein
LGNDLLKYIGCDLKRALDMLITNQQAAIKDINAVDATDQLIPEIGVDEQSDII